MFIRAVDFKTRLTREVVLDKSYYDFTPNQIIDSFATFELLLTEDEVLTEFVFTPPFWKRVSQEEKNG